MIPNAPSHGAHTVVRNILLAVIISVMISACDQAPKTADAPKDAQTTQQAQSATQDVAKKKAVEAVMPLEPTTQTVQARQAACVKETCAQAQAVRLVFEAPNEWITALVDDQLFLLSDAGMSETAAKGKTLQARLDEFVKPDPSLEGLTVAANDMVVSAKIAYQKETFVAIGLEGYYYTGGAHGSAVQQYLNLDRTQHQVLSLDEVLLPNQQKALYDLAYQQYVAWVQSQDPQTNLAAYEKVWPFHVSKQWTLNGQGLVLAYGQYDIGPYVVGMPELTIKYDQLKGIIRPQYVF